MGVSVGFSSASAVLSSAFLFLLSEGGRDAWARASAPKETDVKSTLESETVLGSPTYQ